MLEPSASARRPALPALLWVCAHVLLFAGCGQKGPLYLPEQTGEVVTRPTQTPPPETGGASSSPQSVDSPAAGGSPAPEVGEPGLRPAEPAATGTEEDKKDGAKTPPPK
jgi:predicted small lipoprotein YifL